MSKTSYMRQRRSLNIKEACCLLGVSEASLRRWTDEGRVPAFTTPGGHRRYGRAALEHFMAGERRVAGIRHLAAHIGETVPSHREIAQAHIRSTSFHGVTGGGSLGHLAKTGKLMLRLVTRYVTTPARRPDLAQMLRRSGNEFGEQLSAMGVPLMDAVEEFLQHWNAVVGAASGLTKEGEVLNGRAIEAIPQVSKAFGEALLGLIGAYDRRQSTSSGNNNGGPF